MKKIILVLLFLFLLPCFAFAGQWKEIGYKTYIETSTVEFPDNTYDTVYCWLKILNDKPLIFKDINGEHVNHILVYYAMNFKSKRLGTWQCIWYSDDGSVLDSVENSYPDYDRLVPNSRGKYRYDAVRKYIRYQYGW